MYNIKSLKQGYFRYSWKLLVKYQQVYIYPILLVVFILLPKWFSVNEKYFVLLSSFNLIIILWLYSPFYLSQFSFSPEDARSLSLFDINFRDIVIVRNLLNFALLLVTVVLNLTLSLIFYPIDDQIQIGLIVLSFLSLFPAITIGNIVTGLSIKWNTGYNMSWKSIFVIVSLFFTDVVIKISIMFFSAWIAGFILIILFIVYLAFYYISFRHVVKTISTHFSLIAEN
jgi:hypothetical protein